jgi:phosphoribosyl 1,2-cyclic phosphate phosphodiesterase
LTQIIFNGTGSSPGVPQLFCDCVVCKSPFAENKRTRFSITVIEKETVLQVDLPFELRLQLLRSGIKKIDAVWLTHPHSDHIAGIDDIRLAAFRNRESVPVFGGTKTLESAKTRFPYMFFENEYVDMPILTPTVIDENPIKFKDMELIPLKHFHGATEVHSFRMNDFGLLADISSISESELEKIKGVKVLAVCTTVRHPHKKHMNLDEIIELIKIISPQKAYLTHMNHSFDYFEIKKHLPQNIFPAFDGLRVEVY